MLSEAKAFVLDIAANIERKHLVLASAGLAYYFVLLLVPMLMALAAGITYLPFKNGGQGLVLLLAKLVPPQALPSAENLLSTVGGHRKGILFLGLMTSAYLASKAVQGVIMALDMVYEVEKSRRIWEDIVVAFGLTVALGLFLVIGVVLTLAGPFFASLLSRVVPMQSLWLRLWPFLHWIVAVLVIFVGIALTFGLAPSAPAKHRPTIPGAAFAATSWIVLAWVFGVYLQRYGTRLDNLYGLLSAPIALMLWLHWSSSAILLGAQINSSLESYKDRFGHRIMDNLPSRSDRAA